jgi:hypothetical protein
MLAGSAGAHCGLDGGRVDVDILDMVEMDVGVIVRIQVRVESHASFPPSGFVPPDVRVFCSTVPLPQGLSRRFPTSTPYSSTSNPLVHSGPTPGPIPLRPPYANKSLYE